MARGPAGPKGTPTTLNLEVLRDFFRNRTRMPNKIEAVSVPHMRRCMAAGLLMVDKATRELVLTADGRAAIDSLEPRRVSPNVNLIYARLPHTPENVDHKQLLMGVVLLRKVYPGEPGFDIDGAQLQRMAAALPDTWDEVVRDGGPAFEALIQKTR